MKKNIIHATLLASCCQFTACDSLLECTPFDFLTNALALHDNHLALRVFAILPNTVPPRGSLAFEFNVL